MGFVHALKSVCISVFSSAYEGQTLPRTTLVVLFHTIFHFIIFNTLSPSSPWASAQSFSKAVLVFNIFFAVVGLVFLIALFRHSVQTIFNRNLPFSMASSLPSFNVHLSLLRPIEIVLRYLTSPFRILPDVIILGEVRCGTTTLCHHLSKSLPKDSVEVGVPFCLWRHPELDHKESFYFVGHYLGFVSPKFYPLCFPLCISKWYYQTFRRKLYMSFDGCAQYLTSPTAPYLIARAYKERGLPPPVLVACVRDPVDQAVSWWRYENNAMKWGESMKLNAWNTSLRSASYPPKNISSALQHSQSSYVQKAYEAAEDLGKKGVNRLPPWAMTWPCGQLSAIGRNGKYAENIQRYERVFRETFGKNIGNDCIGENDTKQKSLLDYVTVVPLESLSKTTTLSSALASIVEKVISRQKSMHNVRPFLKEELEQSIRNALGQTSNGKMIQRNPGALFDESEPTQEDKKQLKLFFGADTRELEQLCNKDLKWKTSSRTISSL